MFPFQLGLCCGMAGPLLFYFFTAAIRAAPILVDMLSGGDQFPFCRANHLITVAFYGLFTVFLMCYSAYTGRVAVEKLCRAEYKKMRQALRARRVNRRDEEAASLQSREGFVQGDHDGSR